MKQSLLPALLFVICSSTLQSFESTEANELQQATANKNIVRIFPNPTHNGSVDVVSTTAEKIHFYVFDLEGIMLHQVVLRDRQKHTINNLKKGIYMYDVFKDDRGVEQGKIIVK